MARIDNLTNFLTDVADAIRTKKGTQATIQASAFDTQIDNLDVENWSDVGYSSKPQSIDLMHNLSKQILEDWDPDNPHKFYILDGNINRNNAYYRNIVILPLIDTSNVTEFAGFFKNCASLKEVPAIVVKDLNIYTMFQGCRSLEKVDLSNFDTSNMTNLGQTFSSCNNLATLDLSSFDTSNVTDLGGMFLNCFKLKTILFGNNFTFESATKLSGMFSGCFSLDNNTLNQILHICTTVGNDYTNAKTLAYLGIGDGFDNFANIPNLSNYQDFLDAGWTIS